MAKYKVIKAYVDKYTKAMHPAGTTVDLTPERAEDLAGYIEIPKKKKAEKK